MDHSVTRRQFIHTAALASVAGLTACSGLSSPPVLVLTDSKNVTRTGLTPPPLAGSQRRTWIDWDEGRPIQVRSGETATCTGLHSGQLYCIFIYNTSGSDHDVTVTLVWSNASAPEHIVVPGTRTDEGPASLAFVSGTDTSTVSVSISGSNSCIECFIGSVGMPRTTLGLRSIPLLPSGKPEPLHKGYRYHAVLDTSWYEVSFENEYTQSQLIQFSQNQATVYVLNPVSDVDLTILAVGTVKEGADYSIVKPQDGTQPQRIQLQLQGNGEQLVWICASSYSNAKHTTITLQSISAPGVADPHSPSPSNMRHTVLPSV